MAETGSEIKSAYWKFCTCSLASICVSRWLNKSLQKITQQIALEDGTLFSAVQYTIELKGVWSPNLLGVGWGGVSAD